LQHPSPSSLLLFTSPPTPPPPLRIWNRNPSDNPATNRTHPLTGIRLQEEETVPLFLFQKIQRKKNILINIFHPPRNYSSPFIRISLSLFYETREGGREGGGGGGGGEGGSHPVRRAFFFCFRLFCWAPLQRLHPTRRHRSDNISTPCPPHHPPPPTGISWPESESKEGADATAI